MIINRIVILWMFSLLLVLLSSCKREEMSVAVIEMDNMQIGTLLTSDYFESLEYIPLETLDTCLIDHNLRVHVFDDSIITLDERNCFVFDRQTGKWLRKIGIKGRGPNDYLTVPRGLTVNEQDRTLFLSQDGGGLIEYSLTDPSAALRTIQFPPLSINHLLYMERDIWAVGLLNFRGNNANLIMFYDHAGAIDSIPNSYKFTPKTNVVSIDPGENLFYRYDDDVYYKNLYNDTLFRIADRQLQPAWVLQMGRPMQTLGELRGDFNALSESAENYYLINSVLETDEFLFYTAMYRGANHAYIFDKKQSKLTEVEHEKFINDLDGGLSFWPNSATSSGELVQVLEAYEMKELLTDEYFAAHPAKDPAAHERLRSLLKNLNETDNPVVVVAKLK